MAVVMAGAVAGDVCMGVTVFGDLGVTCPPFSWPRGP